MLIIIITTFPSLPLPMGSIRGYADSRERRGYPDSGASRHIKPCWKYITSKKTQRWPLPSFHPFTFAGKLLVAFVSTALSRASETAVQQKKKERGMVEEDQEEEEEGRKRERGKKKQSATTPLAAACPTILTRRENKSCDTHTREPRIGPYSLSSIEPRSFCQSTRSIFETRLDSAQWINGDFDPE